MSFLMNSTCYPTSKTLHNSCNIIQYAVRRCHKVCNWQVFSFYIVNIGLMTMERTPVLEWNRGSSEGEADTPLRIYEWVEDLATYLSAIYPWELKQALTCAYCKKGLCRLTTQLAPVRLVTHLLWIVVRLREDRMYIPLVTVAPLRERGSYAIQSWDNVRE